MNWRSLKILVSCAVASAMLGAAPAPPDKLARQSQESTIHDRVEDLLRQMTLQEKVDLCHGGDSFSTKAIPRLGIRSWQMTDGPGGVRTDGRDKSTYFPTGVSLASTWDPNLIYRTGQAMGQEARFYHKDVLLGPAVNIDRTPLGGRSFEYMSEDPFLAGTLAVQYIKGVQSQGVAACIKHFAANSQEIDRGTIDAKVPERALQEIYLPAFKAGVVEGHALAVMSAYNKVQGTYCTANNHLQNQILKGDWGFKGVVMSDWGATHDTIGAAMGGLDLEMPGSGPNDYMGQPLLAAVRDGRVPESVVDDKVRRILRAILITDMVQPAGIAEANSPRHQTLARSIAESAITLLKNDRATLPLKADSLKSIAVIGPWATADHGGGGGSSSVYPPYEVTALQGLRKRLGVNVRLNVAEGASFGEDRLKPIPASALHPAAGSKSQGLLGRYFDNERLQGSPKANRLDPEVDFRWTGHSPISGLGQENFSASWDGVLMAPRSGEYQIGTSSDDGSRLYWDGKLLVDNWGDHATQTKTATLTLRAGETHAVHLDYYQAAGESEMIFGWIPPASGERSGIDQAADVARRSDVALVFVGTNHSWDTEGSDKPSMKLMGNQAALVQAVAEANPRTVVVLINGSPVEVASWINKVPALLEAWYPGMEGGNAIASVLFGDVNPSGKLPVTFPAKLADSPPHANGDYPGQNGELKYDEGVYVGYRYFDTMKVKPQFPFGLGLSYTTFKYDNLTVDWKSPTEPIVRLDVTNTGKRGGAEVAELYVHQMKTIVDRPEKELKGFQKVYLEPGQSRMIQIPLDVSSFSYFDPQRRRWSYDRTRFDLLVGSSSRDIRAHQAIDYPGPDR